MLLVCRDSSFDGGDTGDGGDDANDDD